MLIIVSLLTTNLSASVDTAQQLPDITVKDKDIEEIEPTQETLTPEIDPLEYLAPDLQDIITPEFSLPIDKSGIIKPIEINTKILPSPWLHNISRQPVYVFRVQVPAGVEQWSLLITDIEGNVFHKIISHKPPSPGLLEVPWDGKNVAHKMLDVGSTFGYIFHFIYHDGHMETTVGEPFTINALYYERRKSKIISISLKHLFIKEAVLSSEGKLTLKEASDILKQYYIYPITIKVYSSDKELAEKQVKIITEYIAQQLFIPSDVIKTNIFVVEPKYYHVEIIAEEI